MIPKILHYVWVGDQEKPELVLKCIESWKKYCPDYEIKEWGNEVLKNIDNAYVKEAFKARKWAFVSDYLRLYALKTYGGFYVDSDLEITANLDEFCSYEFVSGYENYNHYISPITALMGASKESKIITSLLKDYDDKHFILPDGTYDQTTNTITITHFFEREYGLKKPYDGTKRTLLGKDGIIEPYFIFCRPEIGKKNVSIHHFNGSWVDGYSRKKIFSFGRWSWVKFKKLKKITSIVLPLKPDEKIVFSIKRKLNSRIFALVKKI